MAKRPPRQSNSETESSDNPPDGAGKSHPSPTLRKRLDVLIFERGLAESRQKAQAMLLAGSVRVNGQTAGKAGTATATDAAIEIVGDGLKYVGRGGLKLEGALEDFGVLPAGKVCLDAGSSTGGFTDCLLQNGAKRVFAVDVNIRQLDWKLQRDERVVRVEKNARYLLPEDIAERAELIVVDVSFISVAKILPALIGGGNGGSDFSDFGEAAVRVGARRNRKGRDRPRSRTAPKGDRAGAGGGDRCRTGNSGSAGKPGGGSGG